VERRGVAEPRRGHEEQRGGEDGPAGERAAPVVLASEQDGSERDGPRAGAASAPVRGEVGGEMHPSGEMLLVAGSVGCLQRSVEWSSAAGPSL